MTGPRRTLTALVVTVAALAAVAIPTAASATDAGRYWRGACVSGCA